MRQAYAAADTKWFEYPVTHVRGGLADISRCIPEFERRPFAASQPGGMKTRLNERFDMIVRKPHHNDADYVPVGIVSKSYALVPHAQVFAAAVKVLQDAQIPAESITADLAITQYGERMQLRLYLPDAYNFDAPDGHTMKLRLECLNSVDGSMRFRALVGWLRFVCGNGLVIGVKKADVWRRHSGDMGIEEVNTVLKKGLVEAQSDKIVYARWHGIPVNQDRLIRWIEKPVQKAWGFKAAARAWHIAQTGCDAELIPAFEKQRPVEAQLKSGRPVPGSPQQAKTLYDIVQILAWLAQERRDVQEQLQWRQQIPGLMARLAA